MIDDVSGVQMVSQLSALPLVPQRTSMDLMRGENGAGFIQPVENVLEYLDQRRPRPSCEGEERLLMRLTEEGREEVEQLNRAVLFVHSLTKGRNGLSVSAACQEALTVYANRKYVRRLSAKMFRETYDLWAKAKDWVALVNMSKAPAAWKPQNRGLPEAFLEYCAEKFGEYKRADGKRQAVEAIKTIWRTGRDEYGAEKVIPGYEKGWSKRVREIYPDGWHYSNILKQIAKRDKFSAEVRAQLHEGTAAAKKLLPHHLGTRSSLRFMEEVTFDDVRTDWLVFDPETGQPCELWLLIARDSGTRMVLGFVMHFSHERENDTDSHLGLKEMKQLAAWLLERYPLPKDYIVHWKVERGTATLSKGSRAALQEMLPNRIQIHYTSMIGSDKSPTGYKEKRKGNSDGKASHESHNRLLHTQTSYVPAQTGAHYKIRPQDLDAYVAEATAIWKTIRPNLPEHLRGQEKYNLFTPAEARAHLVQAFVKQNFRHEHAIEGFDDVLEWFDTSSEQWVDRSKWDGRDGVQWRKRKERPVERAARLIAGHEWEFVSLSVIVSFLKHTVKQRPVEKRGEITLTMDNVKMTFAPAANAVVPVPKTDVLVYFNESDPAFLHVTDGSGTFFGTWYRRGRVSAKDEESLKQAFRYTAAAMAAVKERAEQLAAPTRERLEAIRAHNAELQRGAEYIDIARPELPAGETDFSAPIAHTLATIEPNEKQRAKKEKAAEADYERIAREALQNNHG